MRTSVRLLGFALVVALLVSCAVPPVSVPPTGATAIPEATTAVSPTVAATEAVSPTTAATEVVSPTTAATTVATEAVGVVSPTVAATEAVSPTGTETTAATTAASTGLTIEIVNDPTYGPILVGPDGRALYFFTSDTEGVSSCTGNCATAWPPLTVPSEAELLASPEVTGILDTIQRPDGTLQVTINGMPVYYYQNDTAAGDTKGQGLNDKWYLVTPLGEMIIK